MNQTEKRAIRSMLRKGMTITQIYNQTKFTVGQIMSAPFAWFTYFCGEVCLYKTRDDFRAIQKQTIHTMRDLRPIEELTSIPQLEINKYWQRHGFIGNALEDNATPFRLIDNPATIYRDLTDTESIDPGQKRKDQTIDFQSCIKKDTLSVICDDARTLADIEHTGDHAVFTSELVLIDGLGNRYSYDGMSLVEGKLEIRILVK